MVERCEVGLKKWKNQENEIDPINPTEGVAVYFMYSTCLCLGLYWPASTLMDMDLCITMMQRPEISNSFKKNLMLKVQNAMVVQQKQLADRKVWLSS